MSNHNPPTNGFDKRKHQINRKGRPRSFDALRELAQQIAHEAVEIGDRKITVTEAILRQWAQSKSPILQRGFLEIAYGKVPDEMKVQASIELQDLNYDERIKRAFDILEAARNRTNNNPTE
jgi:hypothetical protein